ncbi:MAG: hypothetical protein CMJ78_11020 [Planctomycetaceae bacterium]|nr:hypothetical protein [Planctomycetaceae bacterium]
MLGKTKRQDKIDNDRRKLPFASTSRQFQAPDQHEVLKLRPSATDKNSDGLPENSDVPSSLQAAICCQKPPHRFQIITNITEKCHDTTSF